MGLDYKKILTSKHKALAERSFKTKLELFLFWQVYREEDLEFEITEFLDFAIENHIVDCYEQSWGHDLDAPFSKNRKYSVSRIDKLIGEWENENNTRTSELKIAYIQNFDKVLSLKELEYVFPENPKDRICYYTGLSDADFERMWTSGLIKTKRARGKVMEIDRLNSNKEYTKDNIVLACYWANNAKTDEFTLNEFKNVIGPSIGQVFRNRLL